MKPQVQFVQKVLGKMGQIRNVHCNEDASKTGLIFLYMLRN
jgi:hypothetical protein